MLKLNPFFKTFISIYQFHQCLLVIVSQTAGIDYHLFVALLLMDEIPLYKRGLSVFEIFRKRRVQIFLVKKEGLVKWRVCFRKRGFYSFLCQATLSNISLCVRCVGVCFAKLHQIYQYFLCFMGKTSSY